MFLHVCLAVLSVVVMRFAWRRWKYDLHKIPSPPGLPLLGHTITLMTMSSDKKSSTLRARWFKQLGHPKLMKLNVFGFPMIFVRDMDCAKNVVMSTSDPFPTGTLFIKGLLAMMGDHPEAKAILTTRTLTPYVKEIRRLYSTAFNQKNLEIALPKMQGVMKEMMGIIEAQREKGPVDLQELFLNMTLDVLGKVAFDTNLGALDGSRNLQDLLLESAFAGKSRGYNPLKKLYTYLFPKSNAAHKYQSYVSNLDAEWERIAKEVTDREATPVGEPFWYGLKNMIDPETQKPIAFQDLRAEVACLIIAGKDPTGGQLTWTLALLAANPRVTEKILQECRAHGIDRENLQLETLSKVPYLDAVIKEGMRIGAAAGGTFLREAPRDMPLLGYRIPKGTIVVLAGNRGTDPESEWGDPQVFRPERWLTNEDMSQKYYLGFSYGPRNCAGQQLAMTEMRLALVLLLEKYRFELTAPLEELMSHCRHGLGALAADGMWMRVTPREELKS